MVRLCNVDQFCLNTSSIIVNWGLPTFQTWASAPQFKVHS